MSNRVTRPPRGAKCLGKVRRLGVGCIMNRTSIQYARLQVLADDPRKRNRE